MSNWFTTHDGLLARAWESLIAGAGSPETPGYRVVLATLAPDGAPEARLVVLRGADPLQSRITIYTDSQSGKIAQLRADPRATVNYWNEATQLQLRLRGTISIANGGAVIDTWEQIRLPARYSYAVKPSPGTPIPRSDAYSRIPDPKQFAVLTLNIDDIDIVHLSHDYHRRARYLRHDDWQGEWLAP